MNIKPILEAPPNKTTTKALLKSAESGTYLEITEDVIDIQDLYFKIQDFMQHLTNKDLDQRIVFNKDPISGGISGGICDLTGPVSCCYSTKKGYIIIVTTGCVVKWLDKIYTEGETLGIIKDREMI